MMGRIETTGRSSTYGIALAIGITVFMWASAFPGIRIALTSFSPSELAFLRFAIASAALAAFWAITRSPLPRGREWLRVGFAGGLGISAYNLALNEGEMLINAGTASFLMSLSPMFSVLLGVLLQGERLTRWGVASIGLSFIGVELLAVFGSDGLVFNHGAALVLLAAICQAMQFVIQKPLLERYSALAVTTCVIWAGTLFLLPFASASVVALENATFSAAIAVLFLALGPAAAAYMTWSYALSHYPVSRAVGFLYLIPPISILVSFVTLDERPTAMTLLGGTLALLGVIGMNTIGKQR
jgi:drug/metabolite transporter (DMT)-like permease